MQIYPLLEEKIVGNITSADIKSLLNHWMNEGYAYNTVKRTYILLGVYFRYLTQEEYIMRNLMVSVPMIKKNIFMAAQQKENLPVNETVTVFTPEEIEKFKTEAFRCWARERGYINSRRHTS